MRGRLLALDDDIEIQSFLRRILMAEGYEVVTVSTAKEALELMAEKKFDLVLTDIQLPEMNGIDFVQEVRTRFTPTPAIILMTAYGSVEYAIQAVRLGVSDFLVKPFRIPEIKLAVEKALQDHSQQSAQIIERPDDSRKPWAPGHMIGRSPKMQAVFDLVRHVSKTTVNVLITGETGTGKELVARAIHENSSRARKPFVAINCSAIPETLLESELFGHTRGSFTGATETRRGLFQEADGGTLFLDEIGDMNVSLQAKLLRVIQEKKVKPVGDNRYKDIDTRIIAATHKDLRKAIKETKFREDLYYRLSVIPISIPSLRERSEDIPLLVDHFLRKFATTHSMPVSGLTKDALSLLLEERWEGNVRELENLIERVVILTQKEFIGREDVLVCLADRGKSPSSEERSGYPSLKEVERQYIKFILQKMGGKKEKAAQVLGIDRKTLYRKKMDEETIGTEFESPLDSKNEFFGNIMQ